MPTTRGKSGRKHRENRADRADRANHDNRDNRENRASRASGRFVLRIEPALHDVLRTAAAGAGLSLNDFCARSLAAAGSGMRVLEGAAQVVVRAIEQFGPSLTGVVAHGSWVRAEAADGSDVDVMIVVDRSVALTRALYRAWDADPVAIADRPVEAHVVQLPDPARPPSALWAEIAIDGIVLFERGLEVSRELIRVRRAIADGRLVRRVAHGQPYWTEVA